MKQILTFQTHSFIDVITNSSSELFICDTNDNLEMVKGLLQEMLDLYNSMNDMDVTFDECFGRVYRINTKADAEKYARSMVWWKYDYPSYPQIPKGAKGKELKDIYDKREDQLKEAEEKLIEKEMMNVERDYIGRIIIESDNDNSIPYEIMESIEYTFNAQRYHLG
jgi:hypothetical protein